MNASRRLLPAMAALSALSACGALSGNDVATMGNGSAENRAEEGQISISGPGVQMKIDVPGGLRREAGISGDSGIVYPGSHVGGVHVESGSGEGSPDGEVELRFSTRDSPEQVARWYMDPARAREFVIASSGREGEAYIFAGTARDRSRFRVRLAPGAGGGTEARALVADAE